MNIRRGVSLGHAGSCSRWGWGGEGSARNDYTEVSDNERKIEEMAIDKLSRRQFIGGAVAVVGAAALPSIVNIAPAAATPPATAWPGTIANWTLDPVAAARQGWEIYKGKWTAQSG
jgi:hypothetical protein